jgi:hypothetical protein
MDNSSELPPPILREFLYADLERSRSLLAQRVGGVPEEDRRTDSSLRHLTIGARSVFGIGGEGRVEAYEQRSLLDAVFPELEQLLEAEGWLTDISDELHDSSTRDPSVVRQLVSPGSIVRVTAMSNLFDAAYLAHAFAGTAAAASGLMAFSDQQPSSQSPNRRGNKPGPRVKPVRQPGSDAQLEDAIESFPPEAMGGLDVNILRSMVKISRGMFSDGLHLLLNVTGGVDWSITARLQKGRSYLDAEPDILFSRYGMAPLEWTVVGTIGHFSEPLDPQALDNLSFINADGTASRRRMVQGLNQLLALIANQGFADRPPFPGFSIVPLAVYRLIPAAGTEQHGPV